MRPPRLSVFISSILAGHGDERRRVAEALRTSGIADDWIFEEGTARSCSLEDSYLTPLKRSHLMVLLLKDDITEPVRLEYRTAKTHCIPVLVFKAAGLKTSDALDAFLKHELTERYRGYQGLDDLAAQVIEGLAAEVVERFAAAPGDPGRHRISVDVVEGDVVAGSTHVGVPPQTAPQAAPSGPGSDLNVRLAKGDIVLGNKYTPSQP